MRRSALFMKTRRSVARLAIACAVLVALGSASVFAQTIELTSPNGRIAAVVDLSGEYPSASAAFDGKPALLPSTLGVTLEPALEEGLESVGTRSIELDVERTPAWGENAAIRDAYRGAVATLRERGGKGRVLELETRVYDEGVAFRFLFPRSDEGWNVVSDATAPTFDPASDCWPLSWTEATYPREPVRLGELAGDVYPPLTIRLPNGTFASVLEGVGGDSPRANLKPEGGAVRFNLLGRVELSGKEKTAGPWRVVALAENEGALVAQESFLFNLAEPSRIQDASWIDVGKTISNEGNCDIKTEKLKSMVDFAAELGMKYVQIDWGWYGTEWRWTKEEQDKWAETNPTKADDPDWRRNCEADPRSVARGLVPYLPTWESCTVVDLDLPELIRYGKEKGVGICLYVNDRMLKANDLDSLFAEYERWGLAGLKPGFVAYGSQENERAIEDMIAIAARHKLWLCVHDAYLPNGFSRTYPNLYSVEGGGGQEGGHPASHDVTLPFGRCLAGPFDYTPALYCKGKSHAHQASLLLTIYNPAPVIRCGWAIRENRSEPMFGTELEFIRRVPTDWAKTVVLDAKIGRHIAIARQSKDGVWFVGATGGEEAEELELALDFLTPGKKYKAAIWRDAEEENDGWRGTVREERAVEAGSVVKIALKPRGGAVAVVEEE